MFSTTLLLYLTLPQVEVLASQWDEVEDQLISDCRRQALKQAEEQRKEMEKELKVVTDELEQTQQLLTQRTMEQGGSGVRCRSFQVSGVEPVRYPP